MLENLLRRGSLRAAVIVFVSLAAAFLVLDMIIMPWYVDHGTTQTVPSVLGMPLDQAKEALSRDGLESVEAETRPDPNEPPGTIIGQNPEEGAEVKFGRRIYLSVSGGELLVEVPNLRGLSMRDARFALERAGFVLGPVTYSVSDTFFVNTIMEQSAPPGSKIPKGKGIGVVVSEGRHPDELRVPDLVGMTVMEAQDVLAAEGLQIGMVTYQPAANLVPNTIIDQFPRAGAPSGSIRTVDLFVARAGGNESDIEE